MKTINATSQAIQKSSSISFIDKIILYKQFEGIITDIISVTSVKVNGDATSFFSNGDNTLCPLKDFGTELTINAAPTYSALKTTLSFSSSSFTADDLGKTISLKIDISGKMVRDGIDEIKKGIEGGDLTEFDSGYCDVTVDNSDKYFLGADGNGLFDENYVFWFKYNTRFRDSSDTELIYFGGLVDLSDFSPDFFNKTITIRAYGHSYELKRYPAYNVINENEKNLSKISGMNIISFTESADSEPGIKKIYYKPFNKTKLDGVEVLRVSEDTDAGIKVLEFRYPYYFKWNNGGWYKVAVIADTDGSSGELKMYGIGGSGDNGYAVVKFGDSNGLNEYPDGDAQLWVAIKVQAYIGTTELGKEVSNQGTPTVRFDDGLEQYIGLHVQRVLKYINTTTTYSDISDSTNSPETDFSDVDILEANNDEIILVNNERFWGFEVILSDVFTASDIDIYYSTGGLTWSAAMNLANNGLVDNTNGFKVSEKVIWTELSGWAVNDIIVGTTIDYKGYMIKIVRNTATGTCSTGEIKKTTRLIGQNNDFLEVNFDQSLLQIEDLDDEIIIKYDAGNWSFGIWYDNLSLQYLLEQSLDQSHYGSGKRILNDMKINKADYSINIWGKPPKYNYLKNPTTFDIDWTNSIVYVGIGLEVWSCTFQGLWTYLGTAEFWASALPEASYEIKKLWITATYIYVYIIREYNQQVHTGVLGRFNKSTGVFESLVGANGVYGCRICQRDGTRYFESSNYYRQFGQFGTSFTGNTGENVCIPYKQDIWVFDNPSGYALYPAPNLDDTAGGFPEWYFDNYYAGGLDDNSGPKYKSNMGFFALHSNSGSVSAADKSKIGFNWSFGQQGCEIVDKTNNKLFLFKYKEDSDSVARAVLSDLETDASARAMYYKEPDLPNCHCWDRSGDIFYFGFTLWHDEGDNTDSYSYISRYEKTGNRVVSVNKLIHYNNTGTVYTDITAAANADGSMAAYTVTETDDMFYIGHTEKFRNVGFAFNGKTNNYAFEYWNGSSWTALSFTNETDVPDGILTFHMPYDWGKTTVNGSASLWYIRVRCTTFNSSDYLNSMGLYEEVIWDSELDNSGTYSRYMPIWMCLDTTDNVIHGTMFNRDPLGANNPFQWVYFVYDLNNQVCYFQNVGSNYTFDGTYLMKDFVYDEFNSCVHFMTENIRYQDKAGYMVKGEYNTVTHAIILTKEITPRETEWGSESNLVCNSVNGNIFGLTKGTDKILWEYSKSFYPRIELARFNESDSVYEILKYISQIMNCYYIIHSERNIRFLLRESYNGTINLVWNTNMINSRLKPGYWKHKYDSISVDYANPFNDEYSGTKKKGYAGWNRTQLKISNPLIQNAPLAEYISEDMYEFFNQLRIEIDKIGVVPLIQLELLDRVNVLIPVKILEIDSSKYFIVSNIILDSNKNMNIKLLEIK
jgi:hypothetical protein